MMINRTAIICFLGNPHYDTRVNNLGNSLESAGYKIRIIGFDWRNPEFIPQFGKTTVYKLKKNKFSILFYIQYAYLLVKNLLKEKADVIFAEDIYTLPFVYFIAKIKKAKIIYNSRELFGFLAGLREKKFVQSLIARIEKTFIRKVNLGLTTGEMDTEFIKQQYSIDNVLTIRNLPLIQNVKAKIDFRKMFNLPENVRILFYQGVLFDGRGLAPIIKSLKELNDCVFILCGSGEQKNKFVELAKENGVENRVIFIGAINQNELINYTAGADLGLSLIENISMSYYYALPNKLFEYIMASVPVVVSDMPQMKKIVEEYQVGCAIDIEKKHFPINELKSILEDKNKLQEFKINCEKAKLELNWQKEFEKLRLLLDEMMLVKK